MKTTTKIGVKSKLLALLLVVISVIALLCIMPCASASADAMPWSPYPEPDPEPPHECDEWCYTDILYFSDAYISESYLTWFLNDIVDEYRDCHTVFNDFHYFYTNSSSFNSELSEEVGGYSAIKNSLIIYEQRERFDKQVMLWEGYDPQRQTEALKDLFSMWKEANCQIMFICGTDEEFFCDYDNNEFLDYVDIHVNIDLFSYFTDTFFQMYRENGYPSTIILDRSLSYNCR